MRKIVLKFKKIPAFDVCNVIFSFLAITLTVISAPMSPVRTWLSETAGIRFISDNHEFWNSLFFTISSSTLLTIILFYVLSRIPALRSQAASRRSLNRSFLNFKSSCIDIFVVISRMPQSTPREDLLDIHRFKQEFGKKNLSNNDYWSGVANGLNDYYLDLLANHIEELREEIKRQSDKINIYSESDRIELEALARHLRLIQTRSTDYDAIKSLCRSLWAIFSSWDWATGYPNEDRIQTLFSSI